MPVSSARVGAEVLSQRSLPRSDDEAISMELDAEDCASVGSASSSADLSSSSTLRSGGILTIPTTLPSGERGFSIENKMSLADDLRRLASMPELCDVTFIVGDERQAICGVRAVIAARSRVLRKLLVGDQFPWQNSVKARKNSTSDLQPVADTSKPKKHPKLFSNSRSASSTSLLPAPAATKCPALTSAVSQLVVPEFEPEVFRQLIEYLHTGSCMLQARTLLGLINAADHYGVDELKQACLAFANHCITTDTVCPLLHSAERYIQYKSTKLIVQKVMEFIDEHADTVLGLRAFTVLPKHIVQLVLSREELQADELTKFRAAHQWSKTYCSQHSDAKLPELMAPLVENIAFHQMPVIQLMRDVRPLRVVADSRIMTALAFQADPSSVEANDLQPQARRSSAPQAHRDNEINLSFDSEHSDTPSTPGGEDDTKI